MQLRVLLILEKKDRRLSTSIDTALIVLLPGQKIKLSGRETFIFFDKFYKTNVNKSFKTFVYIGFCIVSWPCKL